MLETEMKFRLKPAELEYMVYTKNYNEKVKGTKTYIPTVLVVWKVANIECSLCWGPYMHYTVSQNNPQNRSQGAAVEMGSYSKRPNSVSMCHTLDQGNSDRILSLSQATVPSDGSVQNSAMILS